MSNAENDERLPAKYKGDVFWIVPYKCGQGEQKLGLLCGEDGRKELFEQRENKYHFVPGEAETRDSYTVDTGTTNINLVEKILNADGGWEQSGRFTKGLDEARRNDQVLTVFYATQGISTVPPI